MFGLCQLYYVASIGIQGHAKYIVADTVTMIVAVLHTLQLFLLSAGNRILHGDFLFKKRV